MINKNTSIIYNEKFWDRWRNLNLRVFLGNPHLAAPHGSRRSDNVRRHSCTTLRRQLTYDRPKYFSMIPRRKVSKRSVVPVLVEARSARVPLNSSPTTATGGIVSSVCWKMKSTCRSRLEMNGSQRRYHLVFSFLAINNNNYRSVWDFVC